MKQTVRLTVPELDCADEAQRIQGALNRLPGVGGVQTARFTACYIPVALAR